MGIASLRTSMTRLGRRLAAGAALLAAAGCPPPKAPRPTGGVTVTVDGEVPGLPTDFTPGPPLEEPLPPDPAQDGLAYLQKMAPALRDAWAGFLEDARLRLPPAHPLNDPRLETRIEVVVDAHGQVARVARLTSSGNADFDLVAEEIAQDAGPFPPPPRDLLSDDDLLHVTWLFARDRRQAGVATAQLRRVEWPLDRAIPKLLEGGHVDHAARRLHGAARAAAAADPASPEAGQLLALGTRVMVSALREGLRADDPAIQRLAVEGLIAAAPAAGPSEALAPAARELRSIADGSVELPLRAAAIRALAAIGDRDAAPMLRAILDKDQGANPELSAAAAGALVALGDVAAAIDRFHAWLGSGDRAQVGGALAALARAPVPKTAPAAARHVAHADVGVRIAACGALGAAAGPGRDASAWKGLRAGLDDRDASVRAACARAAAVAAGAGEKDRTAYWRLVELLKDRDERVRAHAALAAVRMEPAKFVKESLSAIQRDKSPVVLAALATGLGAVPGDAPRRLVELAGHDDAGVRAAAIAALAARKDAASRALAAGAIVDPEAAVRLAAVAAIDDPAALEAAAQDPAPEVADAARARRIARLGRWASLPEVTAALGATGPGAARLRLAAAWLRAA